MLNLKYCSLFLVLISLDKIVGNEPNEKEKKCMEEFFPKYCAEKSDQVLEEILKCEKFNKKEVEELEQACLAKVWKEEGKDGMPSTREFRDMECHEKWGMEFEKCINETMTEEKLAELEKLYPPPALDEAAKKIMACECDVYKIKH